jgi:methylmalonyl-CoA mutase N-terminal domain/subunit
MNDPAAPSPVAVSGTAIDELVHVVGQALDQLDQSGAERFCLRFRVGSDFFEEAAKLRAAHGLRARLLEGRFGSGQAAAVRIEAYVPARTAAPGEEDEDVIRGALAATSALIGGADAVDAGRPWPESSPGGSSRS